MSLEQSLHRGFHAIIGGHSVNHEDRMSACIPRDQLSAWGCVNRSSSRFSSVRWGGMSPSSACVLAQNLAVAANVAATRSCPRVPIRQWGGNVGVPGRPACGRRPWPARVSRAPAQIGKAGEIGHDLVEPGTKRAPSGSRKSRWVSMSTKTWDRQAWRRPRRAVPSGADRGLDLDRCVLLFCKEGKPGEVWSDLSPAGAADDPIIRDSVRKT